MPAEPLVKRAVAFVDAQNLFYAAREAFGYSYPNYDPVALAGKICQSFGWQLVQVRFYTGIPDAGINPVWNAFWVRKLAALGTRGAGPSPGHCGTATNA